MYTQKELHGDLYRLTQAPYYVKYQLLKDYVLSRINQQEFVVQLAKRKNKLEIEQVLEAAKKVLKKVQQNGGKLDEDPVETTKQLRKDGKLKEAFLKIDPYLQQNPESKEAKLTFGWVMHDYLKQSEMDLNRYCGCLKALNDRASFSFGLHNEILLTSILWSIRRVVASGEMHANKVFIEFLRFVGYSATFIEQRGRVYGTEKTGGSASRLLISELRKKLNDVNYYTLMDTIGFDWFDTYDYEETSFIDDNDKTVRVGPLVETTLTSHAKRLIKSDVHFATRERINTFLTKLTSVIKNHANFEWLPYHRIQLLRKLDDSERAFSELTEFARSKSREFWVWDLISEFVDGDEKFNCLCAGLLCKAKAEMTVKLQEKSIPLLVNKGFCAEAKYVLDKLIDTKNRNGWKITTELLGAKEQEWYKNHRSSSNLDGLKSHAEKARLIIYRTLPFSDAFITYFNEDKGTINFFYINSGVTKEGFFYKDSVGKPYVWKVNTAVRLKLLEDKRYENLFNVFDVEEGNEMFAANFLKPFSGTFEKVKEFGYIRDGRTEVFVNPSFVNSHNLIPFSTVVGTAVKKWDKKKNRWGWQIASVDRIEEPVVSDFEIGVAGVIKITSKGFGFVDECFVPAVLLENTRVEDGDYVKAKAHKSWDKNKSRWSWKIVEFFDV